MRSNVDKLHFLVTSNKKVKIKQAVMKLAKRKKSLGVHLDSEL